MAMFLLVRFRELGCSEFLFLVEVKTPVVRDLVVEFRGISRSQFLQVHNYFYGYIRLHPLFHHHLMLFSGATVTGEGNKLLKSRQVIVVFFERLFTC